MSDEDYGTSMGMDDMEPVRIMDMPSLAEMPIISEMSPISDMPPMMQEMEK